MKLFLAIKKVESVGKTVFGEVVTEQEKRSFANLIYNLVPFIRFALHLHDV